MLSSDLEAMLPTPISSFTYSLGTSLRISQYLVPLAGVFDNLQLNQIGTIKIIIKYLYLKCTHSMSMYNCSICPS